MMEMARRLSVRFSRRKRSTSAFFDARVRLGEPERIEAAEVAVRHGDGDIFKRVERAQRRAEARAADLLGKSQVDALAREALRLFQNRVAHFLRLPALAAGAQNRDARQLVKPPPKLELMSPSS